jgi:hypothetical protein
LILHRVSCSWFRIGNEPDYEKTLLEKTENWDTTASILQIIVTLGMIRCLKHKADTPPPTDPN